MEIFVYSDESGVFDKAHNDYFVFGGIIFLSRESRDRCARLYSHAEHIVKVSAHIPNQEEAKAACLPNQYKSKLFRALNNQHRFGVIIKQNAVLNEIFSSKKDKQRYLDFAYKIAVKRMLEKLIKQGEIQKDLVENITFFVDQHTTATNGRYELQQALEQELKSGTYNYNYDRFFPPVFTNLKSLNVQFCNSSKNYLIRAADIISNKIFYLAKKHGAIPIEDNDLHVIVLPNGSARH